MTQVIREENSGTNTILIVLILAAIVAFGVWFFGQGVVPATTEDPGINVDVNLPTGGTETEATGGSAGAQQ
jgi:hypothetical protein